MKELKAGGMEHERISFEAATLRCFVWAVWREIGTSEWTHRGV